jgi:hypothetical protein
MFSGLCLKADARRLQEKNRSHPAMERVMDVFGFKRRSDDAVPSALGDTRH